MPTLSTPPSSGPASSESLPKRKVSAAPKAAAAKKSSKRKRHNFTIKFFRRTHLYFGLALVPFVLLYGITALLFNHPSWFSSSTTTTNDPAMFEALDLPTSQLLGQELLAAIAVETDLPIELVEDSDPVLRGLYTIDIQNEDERRRYRLYPNSMISTLSVTPLAGEEEEEVRVFPEKIDLSGADGMNDLIVERIEELSGMESASVRGTPDLEMRVRADDQEWVLAYDLRTGSLSERKAEDPRREFDFRSYLLRLHKSRGYPMEFSARTFWGVIVDITGCLMIFWAISGIIMWWQLRPTRNLGGLTMLIGLVLSGALAYAMFLALYF